MSKKLAALIIGIFVYMYGTPVLAVGGSGGSQSSGTSQQTQQQTSVSNQGATQQIQTQVQTQVSTVSPTGVKIQNQGVQTGVAGTGAQVQNTNQIQTQNQGEEQSLQVTTQEQETLETGEESTLQEGAKGQKGIVGQQVLMSVDEATKKLDDILTVTMVKGGPGEKIQTIVQAQSEAQQTTKTELQKMDARQGLMKSVLGPDYKALKVMTQLMEQNQVRVMELEQLKMELASQGDITMVEEAIQTLKDQNTALQDKIAFEEQTKSMFGWLFKFFVQ